MEPTLIIKGGNPLKGTVTVSGAKNAAVAILPAALLSDEPCVVDNLPDILDVKVLSHILQRMGAKAEFKHNIMAIDPRGVENQAVPYDLTRHMRASYYLLGAMLGRFGEATIALPGGCVIGSRPIDQHLKGMEALGASPVTMGLSEVYSALQQGTINAVENPLSTLLANSFDEVCKYFVLDRHVYQIQFVVIGTEFFNTLTEEQQNWLIETGTEAGVYQNKLMQEAEANNIQALKDRGVTVTEADYAAYAEAAKSFYTDSKTSAAWSEGLYDRVLAIING